MANVVAGVPDRALGDPTPCERYTVGDLVEHVGGLALDELVLHGWDLARATGQAVAYDRPELDAVHGMVKQFREGDVEGLFGPAVPVPDDAPLLDRILGLAGRDPAWQPPGR